MNIIKIGRREFPLNGLSLKTVEQLQKKLKNLSIAEPDAHGQTDIGDVLMLVLIAVYDGDEKQAYQTGMELAREEAPYVEIEQLLDAVQLVTKEMERFVPEGDNE